MVGKDPDCRQLEDVDNQDDPIDNVDAEEVVNIEFINLFVKEEIKSGDTQDNVKNVGEHADKTEDGVFRRPIGKAEEVRKSSHEDDEEVKADIDKDSKLAAYYDDFKTLLDTLVEDAVLDKRQNSI